MRLMFLGKFHLALFNSCFPRAACCVFFLLFFTIIYLQHQLVIMRWTQRKWELIKRFIIIARTPSAEPCTHPLPATQKKMSFAIQIFEQKFLESSTGMRRARTAFHLWILARWRCVVPGEGCADLLWMKTGWR